MPGDWFIDAYAAEVERLISEIKGCVRQPPEIPLDWWSPRLPEPRKVTVAAVDGGGGYEPLVGGSALYIARAMAVFEPPGEPVKLVDVRLVPARDSRILDAIRSVVEHSAALRAIDRLPPGSILLMDGSYRAVVSAALSAVRRGAYGRVSLSTLYTALYSLELLATMASLQKLALEKNITVAYVSKDSGYRTFKEAILLKLLAEEAEKNGLDDLATLANLAYRRYPLGRLRERLLAARKRLEGRLRAILDMALDISYRDVVFIDEFVGGKQGHTLALEVGLGGVYGESIENTLARLCERVDEYIGGREAENCRGLAEVVSSVYHNLASTRMMYVRLAPGDTLLLVETMGSTRLTSDIRSLEPLSDDEEELLAALVEGYAGPRFYNRWLVAAHEASTMRGEHLNLYMRLFDALARARGVNIRFARRVEMGVMHAG